MKRFLGGSRRRPETTSGKPSDDAIKQHCRRFSQRLQPRLHLAIVRHSSCLRRACVRYAHRLISDVTKAEEVINEVMLEVNKTAARFKGRSNFSTWIFGITRYLPLNAVRRRTPDTADNAPVADYDLTPAAVDHDRAVLRRALAKLSTDHRELNGLLGAAGLDPDSVEMAS